jgi:hypothetical protein
LSPFGDGIVLKRFFLALFLLSYFASSAAAAYYRTTVASTRVTCWGETSDWIHDNRRLESDPYPRFREAQKEAGLEFFLETAGMDSSLRVAFHDFVSRSLLWKSSSFSDSLSVRAPPFSA